MTRADQFREVTVEELAAFLYEHTIFDKEWCHGDCDCDDVYAEACRACALRWLREEAK